MSVRVDLLLPGFCGPFHAEGLLDELTTRHPATSYLLSRASALHTPIDDPVDAVYQLAGIAHQRPPVAALSSLNTHPQSVDKALIFANPVYLQADIDQALLYDASQFHISLQETETLVAAFNTHFSEDGIYLEILDNKNWVLDPGDRPLPKTHALYKVAGKNVNPYFPEDDDDRYWRRLLNETQMLFYSHEVNQARQITNQLTINSIWLWGEGRLTKPRPVAYDMVISDIPWVRGFAQHSKITRVDSDDAIHAVKQLANKKQCLVVFDDLLTAATYGDIDAWSHALHELETRLITPIIDLLRARVVRELNLYPCNGNSYTLKRHHFLHFWKRIKPIETFLR